MHLVVIVLSIVSSIICGMFAVDPDSLVDQCARKVAYYAYYRNRGYNLAMLQKKLPEDLNKKIASQLIAIKHKFSFKQPVIAMHREPVYSIVYCNHHRVALGCNGKVLICRINGGNKIESFPLCETHKFCACTFCRGTAPTLEYCSNNRLAMSDGRKIKLYDIKNQKLLRKFAENKWRSLQALAYCGQHRIAVSQYSGSLTIWNVKLGKKIAELANHHDNVTSLAYCGDNTLICHDKQKIKVWNINTDKESLSFDSNSFADDRKALAFVGNNRFAAIAQSSHITQNNIVIRDIATGDNPVAYDTKKAENTCTNRGVAIIDLNDNYFASSVDNTVTIFDTRETKPLLQFNHKKFIHDMLFYDNRYLMVGTDKGVEVCDLEFIINPTLEHVTMLNKGRKWYKKMLTQTLF